MTNDTLPTKTNYTVYYELATSGEWHAVPRGGFPQPANKIGRPTSIPFFMLETGEASRIRIVPTDVGTIAQARRAAASRAAGSRYYTQTDVINGVKFVEVGIRE